MHYNCPKCLSPKTSFDERKADVHSHTLQAKLLYEITDEVKALAICEECGNRFVITGTINWK